jgi:hypothetical protein
MVGKSANFEYSIYHTFIKFLQRYVHEKMSMIWLQVKSHPPPFNMPTFTSDNRPRAARMTLSNEEQDELDRTVLLEGYLEEDDTGEQQWLGRIFLAPHSHRDNISE